jgi:hypothetical protein
MYENQRNCRLQCASQTWKVNHFNNHSEDIYCPNRISAVILVCSVLLLALTPLNSIARFKKKASSPLFLKSRTSAKNIPIHVTPEILTNIYRRKHICLQVLLITLEIWQHKNETCCPQQFILKWFQIFLILKRLWMVSYIHSIWPSRWHPCVWTINVLVLHHNLLPL